MKTVAIIGRTNVGKSTLFNRLIGRKKAIVHDKAGVTRDRREGEGKLFDLAFSVIDTAGLEESGELSAAMWQQTEIAIAEADILLYMLDARTGLTPQDKKLAGFLRAKGKPIILAVNKSEAKDAALAGYAEACALGLSAEPITISAEHGEGMEKLYRELINYIEPVPTAKLSRRQQLKQEKAKEKEKERETAQAQAQAQAQTSAPSEAPASDTSSDEESPYANLIPFKESAEDDRQIKIAIVGRPNVGKSTLVNRLLGENRMLTGPTAGITRDAIAIPFTYDGRDIELIDTAGLRRKSRLSDDLEKLSAADTKRSAYLAQVVILVLDADAVLEKQDLTIADEVIKEGRCLVIAVNKWDIATDKKATLAQLEDRLATSLRQVRGIPFETISAAKGEGLNRLMRTVFSSYAKWNKRVSTSPLNRFLEDATTRHPTPIASNGRRIPMKYITQIKARPPSFVIFSSNPDKLPESYNRYLINGIRDNFDLDGVPIRITLRKPKNPYANKKSYSRNHGHKGKK